jgi:hypothetical protein
MRRLARGNELRFSEMIVRPTKKAAASKTMPAEGTHVTDRTVIAAYPVVKTKATLLLRAL